MGMEVVVCRGQPVVVEALEGRCCGCGALSVHLLVFAEAVGKAAELGATGAEHGLEHQVGQRVPVPWGAWGRPGVGGSSYCCLSGQRRHFDRGREGT